MNKYTLNLELAEFARPKGAKDTQPRKRKFKDHLNNIAKGTWSGAGIASTAAIAPVALYGIRKPKMLLPALKRIGADSKAKHFYEDLPLQSVMGAAIGATAIPYKIRDQYKYEKYYKQQNLDKEKYKWK